MRHRPHAPPYAEVADWAAADDRVKAAGQVAYLFKINPLDALRSDEFEWEVLMAAGNYVAEEVERANEEAQRK